MASSDIIKIGFDYRSSLAQFEKDTNGVFDGISSKAGKQKITIQLDAKDDKVIDKIKELQKLKLDKFTFEFGNSGLKEQLQTFDKLENKINEIINLGKGKSFIDSTPITSAVDKIEDGINGVSGKVDELKRKTSSGDLFGQKQINQSINSVQKLMSLLSKIKDVNKSTYGNKDNYDWTGLYKTRDEAIQDDLSTKKQNLNSSLALILAEDKNAVSALESEINNLKSSLESIQNLANRISSNSSISSLDGKSYAEEYKLINDRLGELNNQYKLTNAELEEYVTLQAKAEKIMDKLMSEAGGVKGSGAKNKSELRSWIEESLASDLGKNSEDIYNGLFGNITDALYNGNGISLFDVDGTKRNLREIAADILKYKSDFSDMTGSFGAKEDFSKLNELKSILSYINKNSDAINNFDFKEQIEAQKRFIKSLESNGASDSLLTDEKKQLEELISLQERLDNARNGATNDNAISQQNKLQEELKEIESQAEKTNDALNNFSTSSTSNDSQIEELKSDIAEVKTELSEVKEKISGIDSEGLENVRNDVEKTKESVKELNNELTDMKTNLSSGQVESNISNGMKDAIQNADTKLDNTVSTAKELDKTLEKVDIPTDSFDEVLNRLNLAKSELVDIVKITRQSISDSDGKFHNSYILKDSRGSTEIYGLNSKTDKGQILRQNIVGYDKNSIIKANEQALKEQNKINQEQIKIAKQLSAEKQKAVESDRKSTVNQASKDQLEAWKQIQRIRKAIANTSNDKLVDQLKQEKKTYQEQYLTATKILKNNSDLYNSEQRLNELKKISLKTTQQIESTQQRQLNGYDNKLSGYQGKVSGYTATINKFGDDGWTSPEYLQNVQKAQKALKAYKDEIDRLKANPDLVNKRSLANVEKLGKDFENATLAIKNMTAAQKGYTQLGAEKALDKITQMVKENSKMSRQAKAAIQGWYNQIKSGNPTASLDVILGKVESIVRAEKEAGRGGKSMLDAIKEKAWYGAASAIGTYFGLNDIFRYGREIADTVIQLDTATTELRKVSDATDQRLVTNFENSAKTAKQLGSTISDVISATADWSRMGYNIDQAEELARVSTLYKNVGDGIDIESANNSLISTLQGFQLDASQAESIIDKFNEVANNYAIDSAGIGEALQRSAASFNAANTDLSKSIALITATNEVVQDPDSVGTLWKTMSARIRGAETELSELNEETDEYTKTTSKLRDLIKSLTGFDIMADEDTFKDIYDIILGIGKEWNNLTDAEQSSLGEALAGKRNANALYAVLGNLDTLQSAYETAENSAGSAQREQENYQKSIQYSIDQTKAKLEELSNDLLSSDFLKGAIDAGGKLIDILDGIVKSGNAIPAIATAISAALSFKNIGKCYVSA